MALRKDGNSKNSSSYKPYDRSNSFVKKMTNTVTGLFSWRSNSQSGNQDCNDVSYSAADDENILPAAKRMRTQCEEETTLLKFIPNSNKTLQSGCSPIQPVNDMNVAGPSNSRNTCIASSTPANFHFSTLQNAPTIVQDAKIEIPNTRVEHNKEESENADTYTTLPLFNIHQRHNVTVPSISKDVPSHMSNTDANKSLTGSFSSTNSRRPSFNVDVFSSSNRRLSLSVCETRNRNCLSPFYKARTMYGGASALLPYGGQTLSRMRSASTSNLDVFSPRSQITMQPVPSPSISNDQETMSTAARRILDTLEKYCSPVADAKRIPLNESSKKSETQQTPRGLKRKLPSLSQMMPSTSDLLRIKRTEKIQDSISSAKQTAASVPESTIVAEDSDSSSDSVELDYSALTNVAKSSGNEYLSKINRKNESKFDDRPSTTVKLPKAELKITNLPKFDVTDMFTFSKPLLLENLDQNDEEPTAAAKEVENVSSDDQKFTSSTKETSVTNKKRSPRTPKNVSKPSQKSVTTKESRPIKKANVSTLSKTFTANNSVFSKSDASNTTTSWTCNLCLANNTGQLCSGCSSNRQSPSAKPIAPPKAPVTEPPASKPLLPTTTSWGDAFKPPSDTWECKECFVRNQNASDKCAACGTSKNKATPVSDVLDNGSSAKSLTSFIGSNDLWKNFQKAAVDQWKCDSCWVQNKKENANCVSCGEPKEKPTKTTAKTETSSSFNAAPKTTFMFGVNKGGTVSPTTTSSETCKLSLEKPATNFMTGSVTAADTKSTFTFGMNPVIATTTASSIITPSTGATEQKKITSSSVPPITFGFKKEVSEATETSKSSTVTFANPLLNPSPFGIKNEDDKSATEKKETITFNDVSSSTNAKGLAMNDTSALKTSKFGMPKTSGPTAKENGNEDVTSGRSIFNDITSSTESPSKRKTPFFSSLFANKESNGLMKSEANSLANGGVAFVSSSSSTFGGIQSSSLLASAGTTKMTNDSTPMFASALKNDQNTEEKKLFPNIGTFTASSTQPSLNSFGSFTSSDTGAFGKKPDSAIAAPNVNTGFSSSSGSAFTFAANVTTPAAPASGGFSFNGPKTEDAGSSQPKFGFSASNPTTGFGSGGLLFSFGAQANATPNDRTPLTNSVFSSGNTIKQPQEAQTMAPNNTVPAFSNNIFGTTNQTTTTPQTANPVKKSGGFNYTPPTHFGSSTINSFSAFPSAPVENQEQNRLNNATTPAPSTFVFGASNNPMTQHNFNLTVPSTFNFTGGNAITSFSPAPSSTGTAQSVTTRKIKKAVRRTTKN